MPNKEVEFYRQVLGEPDVEALLNQYLPAVSSEGQTPAQTPVGYVPTPQAIPGMVYDMQQGDYVSPEVMQARNDVRARQANLAASRAVYGTSPQFLSTTMSNDKGPFAYTGNMAPAVRPSDDYGNTEPMSFSDIMKDAAVKGATNAGYGAIGAMTGGLVGDSTVGNIKEFVSMARSPAIKDVVMPYTSVTEFGLRPEYLGGSRAAQIGSNQSVLDWVKQDHAKGVGFAEQDAAVQEAKQHLNMLEQQLAAGVNWGEEQLKRDIAQAKGNLDRQRRKAYMSYAARSPEETVEYIDALSKNINDLTDATVGGLDRHREPSALSNQPHPYIQTEAMGERFYVNPDGSIEYQPRVHPRLYPKEDFAEIPNQPRLYETRSAPEGVFTTDNPDLMPDWLKDRTDITSYDNAYKGRGVRNYKLFDETPAVNQRYMQYKVPPVDALLDMYDPVPGTDYQSKARQHPMYEQFGQYPNPPEGVTRADFEFQRPGEAGALDPSGMVRGVGSGMAAEGLYQASRESSSVPSAYVMEQVQKMQGGNYIPDLKDVPDNAKPAAYAEIISLLRYGLPEGYFGSERHIREEALSKQFGEPLTEEVKLSRDMMKLIMQAQNQKVIQSAQPSLVDKFKDFGFSVVEAEAAAALAGLL